MDHMPLADRLEDCERLLVLGVGNELRGDDAAGIEFARRLKRRLGRSNIISVVEAGVVPENFIGVVRKFRPSHILVVDAARMGTPPGSMRIVEKSEISGLSFSTHNLSLSFLVSYFEKEFHSSVVVIGIEPVNSDFGSALSKPVIDAVESLVAEVRRILPK
jgi:hydrogenase 3 maturation protease